MMEKVVHFIFCLLDPLLTGRASVHNWNSIEGHPILCKNFISIPLNMLICIFKIISTNYHEKKETKDEKKQKKEVVRILFFECTPAFSPLRVGCMKAI